MPIDPRSVAAPPQVIPLSMQVELPLRGLTVLVVEDSRHAAEGLRLSLQRLGARMRRAETLDQAMGHLRTYRPDAVLIDLGLPDGSGTALIRQLACSPGRRPILLGCSADPEGRRAALAAGAQGFLEKPLPAGRGLAVALAPWFAQLTPPFAPDETAVQDRLALRDDLIRAAQDLARPPNSAARRYLLNHLAGLARCTEDDDLAQLVTAARAEDQSLAPLIAALQARAGPVLWN